MDRRAFLAIFLAACGRINFGGDDGPSGFPIDAPPPACTFPATTCETASLGSMLGSHLASGSTTGKGDGFSGTCGGGGVADVAYQWLAPTAGRYVIDTLGSSFNTVLAIRPSCASPEQACNDNDPVGGLTSAIALTLDACAPLTIIIDGNNNGSTATGSYDLSINRKCPGEFLGSALGMIATGSVAGAGDSFAGTCGGDAGDDVSYQWVAPVTGRYVIDTRGSQFNTVLALRDSCTTSETHCNDNDPTGGLTSAIAVDLTAGDRIFIIIDTQTSGGTTGTQYTLHALQKCPGNELGSAIGMAVATGDTTGQGDSYAGDCGGDAAPDAVFHWTAPTTHRYHFDTTGSTFNTSLSLRASCSTAELVCNDNDPGGGLTSSVLMDMTAGQDLEIIIDGSSSSASGSFTLNINPT